MHRDFKPDNVLVGRDGVVRVTDFGVARRIKQKVARAGPEVEDTQSSGTSLVGTPAYMSPEQFEGKTADARSDQFAFCIALYEALFGSRPLKGDTFETLKEAALAGAIVRPPRSSAVPKAVQAIVLKGLSLRPGDRFEWAP